MIQGLLNILRCTFIEKDGTRWYHRRWFLANAWGSFIMGLALGGIIVYSIMN